MLQHLHLVGADRQRHGVDERRGDAHVARHLDDAGAPGLGVAAAGFGGEADGDGVERARQRRRQRHGARVAAAVILGAPVADADRRVDDDRIRLAAGVEHRGEIDVGLERGAGLAHRVDGAVELADAVIAAADDGAHRAGLGFDHGGGGLADVILLAVLADRLLDRLLRLGLKAGVERGAHGQHAVVAELAGVGELLDLGEGPIEIPIRARLLLAVDRGRGIAAGGLDLPLRQEAGGDHRVQHDAGARAGGGQIVMGGVFGRRLEQAGEHRRFGQRQVARRFAEVEIRRRLHAERAAAHVSAVEIELEDLVLGEMGLQPEGEEGLVDLALERALVGEEQVLGELLGERRAALHRAGGAGVDGQRAGGADRVDAPMVIEAAILGGDQRLNEVGRQILQRQRIVMLDAAPADVDAVAIKEGDRQFLLLQPVLGGLAEGGLRQRQQRGQADDAPGDAFRSPAGEALAPAMRRHALHEMGVADIAFAQAGPAGKQRGIEPGVEGPAEPGGAYAPARARAGRPRVGVAIFGPAGLEHNAPLPGALACAPLPS